MLNSLRRLRDLFENKTRVEAVKDRTLELEILEERQLLAVFTVNSTADEIAEDGDVTLREALQAANTNERVNADVGAGDITGDTIIFDPTVFAPANSAVIVNSDAAGFGDYEITDDVFIDADGTPRVTLSGGFLNRIFDIRSESNGPVRLRGLTLINGDGTDEASDTSNDGRGGAVYSYRSELSMEDVTISGNTAFGSAADDGGGGLYNLGGSVTLRNTDFVGNAAAGTNGSGGGILHNGGGLTAAGTNGSGGGILHNGGGLTAFLGKIDGNSAQRAGGGIEIRSTELSSDVTLTGVNVRSNTALINGGGLHVTAPSSGAPTNVTLNAGGFLFNSASHEGGGLWNDANGALTINAAGITDNVAFTNGAGGDAQGGGGVFNNGGSVALTNARVSNNVVLGPSASGGDDGGGGIFNDGRTNPDAVVTITNTEISGNSALSSGLVGGGVLNIGGALEVNGGSISGNSVERDGGGVATRYGAATLNGVVVSGNSAGSDGGGVLNRGGAFEANGGSMSGNSAGRNGGGVETRNGAATLISGVVVSGNSAGFYGGGLGNSRSGALLVRDGSVTGNSAGAQGGGLWNSADGTLTVRRSTISGNSVFAGNTVRGGGGGVFGAGAVSLNNVTISNNIVTDIMGSTSGGGGVLIDFGSLTITNSTISGNSARSGGEGGGILSVGGSISVNGGTIDGNFSSVGGGLASLGGDALLTDVTIQGNKGAFASAGGGISVEDGVVRLSNVLIQGNSSGRGGGISQLRGDLTVEGGTIAGNSSDLGGGGISSRSGVLQLTGVSISDNTTGGDGGGVDCFGLLTIEHATIVGNSASEGGGIRFSDVARLSNVTIRDNYALRGGGVSSGVNDNLTVDGGIISGNSAIVGGGLENRGDAQLSNVSIRNNIATADGGGISNRDNLTIIGGDISSNSAARNGGGVWNHGRMTVSGTSILNNSVLAYDDPADSQGGGGVFNRGFPGNALVIQNSTIAGNVVVGDLDPSDGGGGVFNRALSSVASVSITNSLIINNCVINTGTAPEAGRGGGILNIADFSKTADLSITGSTISQNSAELAGGGIASLVLDSDTLGMANSTITLDNVVLEGNQTENDGGAVHIGGASGFSTFDATDSTFSENRAGEQGGGLWIENQRNGLATITSSTVSRNLAKDGGGLFLNNSGTRGTTTLANSTVSGNIADDGGGVYAAGGTLTVQNSTVVNNVASGSGGGVRIESSASTTMANSIVANNQASSASDVDGLVVDLSFSLVGDTSGITLAGTNSNIFNVDPKLGPLQNNGGSTLTHAPLSGSPVHQAGDPVFTGLSTDQRGLPRVLGGRLDIGAVEGPANTVKLAGNGTGMAAQIRIIDAQTNQVVNTISPFGGFGGGVRNATADINNDGILDIIAAAGPGATSRVKIFDGQSGTLLRSFLAYGNYNGGVFVAAGDINGDGVDDVITGTGGSSLPHVKVFDGATGSQIRSFFAYGTGFKGGVRVASGDVNGDGYDDIVTATGAGAGRVKVFDGLRGTVLANFLAYGSGFTGGIFVGAADFSGDGLADIVTGRGKGGPQVRVFDGSDPQVSLASFFAFSQNFTGGVRVAVADTTNGVPDILAGTGPGIPAQIRRFDGETSAVIDNTRPFGDSFTGGVFVSGTGVTSGGGSPLHATSQIVNSSAASITTADVEAIKTEVLSRFAEAGLPETSQLALAAVEVNIANLSGSLLGVASGGTITLDTNAAGHGWYVDADPTTDDEFTDDRELVEGRVDLMTALFHEYGHILGLEDLDSLADEVMSETLDPGVRISTYAQIVDRLLHQEEEEDE